MSGKTNGQAKALVDRIYPVSRETFAALETYLALLRTWQAKTNLVAPGTLEDFWTRHVCDSLQALAMFPQTGFWMDLGSGAGFPGMVIAIANIGQPERRHVLVESNHKKCAFLRAVARETEACVAVESGRIESVAKRYVDSGDLPEIVTARALTPLPQLIGLAEPLLNAGSVGLFHKGRDYAREVEDCRGLWESDLVIHESRIEAGSVLLELRNPVRGQVRKHEES
ncbi:MAG: 16S rRNA (guanine(527)-N(7))-methyltransferase RsmG [Salaquimonas sp.]|jgi:16S rRNA (guanine527-N7)-methyltransferase|nr:16S rRNA (guanine(527)-N(7))-methyltransferase RsmG [Salaquimonas sp.]